MFGVRIVKEKGRKRSGEPLLFLVWKWHPLGEVGRKNDQPLNANLRGYCGLVPPPLIIYRIDSLYIATGAAVSY